MIYVAHQSEYYVRSKLAVLDREKYVQEIAGGMAMRKQRKGRRRRDVNNLSLEHRTTNVSPKLFQRYFLAYETGKNRFFRIRLVRAMASFFEVEIFVEMVFFG